MIKGLVLSVLLVVCTGCGADSSVVAEDSTGNVLGTVKVKRINVGGIDCVIAGTGRYDSSAALSCDWK